MEFKALRRSYAVIENAGFAAVPLAYFALASVDADTRHPDLALFAMAFVLVLVWSRRQANASVGRGPAGRATSRRKWQTDALAAADRRFLLQAVFTALVELLIFIMALAWIESYQVREAEGTADALFYAASAALLVTAWLLWRTARYSAWIAFNSAHSELWQAPEGLARGKVARRSAAYFRWREKAALEE